jgi:hypothetical protein
MFFRFCHGFCLLTTLQSAEVATKSRAKTNSHTNLPRVAIRLPVAINIVPRWGTLSWLIYSQNFCVETQNNIIFIFETTPFPGIP